MDATLLAPMLRRTGRGYVPKILVSIAIATAAMLLGALVPAQSARADVYPGGSTPIKKARQDPSPKCKSVDELTKVFRAGTETPFDEQCRSFYLFAHSAYTEEKAAGKSAIGPHIQAATTIAPSLELDTPAVPFLGNRLAGLGRFLSSTDLTVTPPGYSFALRRESNCHLTADFLEDPDAISPAGAKITSIADAQDYYHQLAGLTTTANVFPHGCAYPTLGQPTTQNVLLAGNIAGGGAFAVSATNGLTVLVSDLTANTFGSTTLLSNTAFQGGIAVADLNADGTLDIVATFATNPGNSHKSTAVFIGNGGGTFKTPVYYDFAGDVTVDDVNGDGKPDIVVVGQPGFAGTVTGITTLLGVGDGTFSTTGLNSAVPLPAMSNTSGVLAADFNNDTKKDLLVGGKVYFGAGDGSFTAGAAVTADTTLNFATSTPVAAIGDLNNDNKMDVVLSQPSFVAVFLGNGDGTFTAGPRFAALSEYQQVAITDIDGDGNADVFLGTSTGGIFLDGGATVSPELFQLLMGRGDGSFVDSSAFAQPFIAPVAAADFTGDTKLDVLQLRPNANLAAASSLAVLPGDGSSALGTAIVSSINLSPSFVVATDMTKDGKPDVVLAGNGLSGGANAGPLVAVLTGQSNGTFAAELDYALANVPASLATGDFNGDGFQDIAVGIARQLGGSGPTGVYVLLGQSNGTWAAPVKIDASLNPSGLAAGNLNGDGFADLVVADQGFFNFIGGTLQVNGAVHVYLGKADGSFTTAASPTTTATNYSIAALGDFDGDGKLDLFLGGNVAGTSVGTGTPNVYTLKGVGDGTFQAATGHGLAGSDGIGANSIALADFDHDGHLDAALGNSSDYTEFLMGRGAGNFARTLMVLGREPGALAAADLNGDGFPELLVVQNSAFAASLTVFRNADAWSAGTTPPVTAATTTTLTAAPSPVTAGQTLTLTAGVTSASAGTLTGNVTFFDGVTSLGSAALSAGSASLSTTTLAAGAHSLTATYAGDSAFGASTSTAVALTVNAAAANFAVSASPTSGSASAGASAATTITLTPSGGFNQTVTLACSGLPSGASCAFSPASVPVAGSAATSALTITTTIRTAANFVNPLLPGGAMLAGMFVPIFVRRRRLTHVQKRGFLPTLLFASALLLTGCHGHSSSPPAATGTPAGTYAVTITATAGATSHTAAYSLTVN